MGGPGTEKATSHFPSHKGFKSMFPRIPLVARIHRCSGATPTGGCSIPCSHKERMRKGLWELISQMSILMEVALQEFWIYNSAFVYALSGEEDARSRVPELSAGRAVKIQR